METESFFSRFNHWLKTSLLVKTSTIGSLMLILLIPSSMIESVIYERQMRAEEAFLEVSSKWGEEQIFTGPFIQVPYELPVKVKDKEIIETRQLVFLPQSLDLNNQVIAEQLNRGVFESVVFRSKANGQAQFTDPNLEKLGLSAAQVKWEKAQLLIGFSDLRGCTALPQVKVNGKQLVFETSQEQVNGLLPTAHYLSAACPLQASNNLLHCTFNLELKGSKAIGFLPVGKTSKFKLQGNWPNPTFNGQFLPDTRMVTDTSFSAEWKILSFNRAFPDQWIKQTPSAISEAYVKTGLLVSVDQYLKSVRSIKYSMLVIFLTFLSLFFIEVLVKIRIHPFQYLLIGAAVTLFYILLLSISEQSNFGFAYFIAALMVILLIGLYGKSIMGKWKYALLFSGVLSLFYVYVFVLIQEQQYALLMGSLGLFLVLTVLMYVSRNINWYKGIGAKE